MYRIEIFYSFTMYIRNAHLIITYNKLSAFHAYFLFSLRELELKLRLECSLSYRLVSSKKFQRLQKNRRVNTEFFVNNGV